MKREEFKKLLKESFKESLKEVLPVIIKELLPTINTINERKASPTVPTYVNEIKRSVGIPKPVTRQKQSFKAPVNSADPIKNMLAETFNSMLPDDFEDHEVPQEQFAISLPSTVPNQPVHLVEGNGPSLDHTTINEGKSVLAALKPKVSAPLSTEFNPEADIENITIENVPDFTKLMANRTFK